MKKGAKAGLVFISPVGVHMRHPTPRHQGRLPAGRQPSHEGVELPRRQDGCVLPRGPTAGGQIQRPRTQSHPEAADALVEAASGRELVPRGVFASDQRKPSVHYEGSERVDKDPSDLAG